MTRTVTQLADRNAGFAARRATTPTCPKHPTERLDGGPVQFHCDRGHAVMAADISHEHRGSAA